MSIEWCPTEEMVADFVTKPLQGALFKQFRDQIMRVVPMEPIAKDSDKNKPRKRQEKFGPSEGGATGVCWR